jgi:phthiodiolone/phenolphthiodiolone dimycocerosates ketoreductase
MAPSIKFGLGLGSRPPISQTRNALRFARLFRFDSAWVIDHFLGLFPDVIWDKEFTWMANGTPHDYLEYQTLLGHVADSAGKVQLGVGVTEAIRRHPVVLAQAFMTLSHMTKVPPILGIGSGERENTDPYGLSFERPVSRLEEALQIVRICFDSSGPFEFSGEFWNMPDAIMDLQPKPGNEPKIWVAAHGPRMLRLTGTYADGWYPAFVAGAADYGAKLKAVRAAAEEAGRNPEAVEPGMQAYIVAGKTEEHVQTLLDHRAVKFLGLLAPADLWASMGLAHPLGDGFAGMSDFVPQRYEREFLLDAIDQVPPELLRQNVLAGTPDQIEAQLGDFRDAGLRHVMAVALGGLASKKDGLYNMRTILRLKRHFS